MVSHMNELFIWVSMKLSDVWACIKKLFPIATCGCETQALSKLDISMNTFEAKYFARYHEYQG